jgi:hypothetical protein
LALSGAMAVGEKLRINIRSNAIDTDSYELLQELVFASASPESVVANGSSSPRLSQATSFFGRCANFLVPNTADTTTSLARHLLHIQSTAD